MKNINTIAFIAVILLGLIVTKPSNEKATARAAEIEAGSIGTFANVLGISQYGYRVDNYAVFNIVTNKVTGHTVALGIAGSVISLK